jgi:hypothetical protein
MFLWNFIYLQVHIMLQPTSKILTYVMLLHWQLSDKECRCDSVLNRTWTEERTPSVLEIFGH